MFYKNKKIKKAIIPVAGLGTRMLPITKIVPKELLPIGDKPIIQHIVEECIDAGIEEIILVSNPNKLDISQYFTKNEHLEEIVKKSNNKNLIAKLNYLNEMQIKISNIMQDSPKGLGHAILCAKNLVQDEPFAVVLPDVLLEKKENLSSMVNIYEKMNKSSILVEQVPIECIEKYGIVSTCQSYTKERYDYISDIIEKPKPSEVNSNLAVVGRYIFTSEIWTYLENVTFGKNEEIQLTDAIKHALSNGNDFIALPIVGDSFDCGSPESYKNTFLRFGF